MSYSIHIGPNIRQSPFFEATVADGLRSLSVYNHMYIPGNFGDPEGEYQRLMTGVAMWDVAAQRQVELAGPDAGRLAQYLTPRDISSTRVGQGRYVPICDHDGWLINDPVLLKLAEDRFWLSIADSDLLLWAGAIARERGWDVHVFEPDVSPLAIQGPKAEAVTAALFGDWVRALKYFWFKPTELEGIPLVLARSGWSKQGGFELYLQDGSRGWELWQAVKAAGAAFDIGPGAPNDIERLESGLISYGADMRRQEFRANPFEMGFGGLLALDADFDCVGKQALLAMRAAGQTRRRSGFVIEGAAVAGNAAPLTLWSGGQAAGWVSEIAYSKRLGLNIGVGLADCAALEGQAGLHIELPDGPRALRPAGLPFAA
jgi:aminomethyltransferase